MAKKLGVGIVGTGWVSEGHITAYQNNSNVEIVSLCGRTVESAEKKAGQYRLSVEATDDYSRMLANPDIDIISICTPNHLHPEQTIQAARAGKHIIIEKPVALNMEDLGRMVSEVEKAGVKTIVSFVLRWNPLFVIIDQMLKDGTIGDIFYAEVDYMHGIGPWYKQYEWNVKKDIGGSSLLSAGCHAMDGLLWFSGKEVVEVTSYGMKSSNPSYKDYEYPPSSVTILKFADGSTGKVASSLDCTSPYVFNINLLGSNGTIRNNQVWSKKFAGQTSWVTIPTILPDSGDVSHHPFQGEIDHFVDCIINDKRPSPDLAEAAKVHEIKFAADLSAEKGRPVALPL
jgi:predicted dehydrogenase